MLWQEKRRSTPLTDEINNDIITANDLNFFFSGFSAVDGGLAARWPASSVTSQRAASRGWVRKSSGASSERDQTRTGTRTEKTSEVTTGPRAASRSSGRTSPPGSDWAALSWKRAAASHTTRQRSHPVLTKRHTVHCSVCTEGRLPLRKAGAAALHRSVPCCTFPGSRSCSAAQFPPPEITVSYTPRAKVRVTTSSSSSVSPDCSWRM
ncbi:uncharacterized protein LOC118117650 isoform X1 [Hippoglossus stenolepis]|uniref:uncharacterized protein LOC118117650 isoform X1 n=1 Tax=Hippoglossus stenolepis TaxID=195615 RepID=UPI001FAF7101|nr:uncharacterized protein LOC118117650 isoform X1 [Hippoglossus stenolepis]